MNPIAATFDRNSYQLDQTDPELFDAIQKENSRHEDHIELIASENYTSPAVMALGQPHRPARHLSVRPPAESAAARSDDRI